MTPEISDIDLGRVCAVISTYTGLHFPVERWSILGRNLVPAAQELGFTSFDTFINWLIATKLNKEQVEILASYLTISETYFWREPQVFEALTNYIIPELIESKKVNNKSIRIWSAGCSSGEEAYSLAIALHRTIPKIKDWTITVLATDLNYKSLAKAKRAVYGNWSFRNSPSWLIPNYFTKLENEKYEVISEIRNMVSLAPLNLSENNFPSHGNNTYGMDIIFCRNVLMYFSEDWISKITAGFYQSLTQKGWFVVSSCELSSQLFPQFKAVNFEGAVLYSKGSKATTVYKNIPDQVVVKEIPFPVVDPFLLAQSPKFHYPILDFDLYTIQESIPDAIPIKEVIEAASKGAGIPTENQVRLLANQGNLKEALATCNELIESNKLSSSSYFLRASIYQELQNSEEAISSLKKAVYLEPDFIMGHFALGNIFINQGKEKNAIRHFNNVIDLVKNKMDDEILSESDGLPVKYIREIVLANLQKHKKP